MSPLSLINIIRQRKEKGKGYGGDSGLKKMGRPRVEKPKDIKYSIRTDVETERRLEKYCAANGITKGEAYRKGINLLLEQNGEE